MDKDFLKFLEKIQDQNKGGLALQALQVKYNREMAGEDNDKREEQLNSLANIFKNVEKAITGFDVKIDFTPLKDAVQNQTLVLQKSLEEQTLLRKVSEGSLEYDKESAQYRNVSGREITSDVSGKTVKEGGYIDFETAANRLAGQSKRVRESDANKINFKPLELGTKITTQSQVTRAAPSEEEGKITGFGTLGDLSKAIGSRFKGIYDFMTNKVQKNTGEEPNPGVTGKNPEADNIRDSQEVMADSFKSDLEISKELKEINQKQLDELVKIGIALTPKTPEELPGGTTAKAITGGTKGAEVQGASGSVLPDVNIDIDRSKPQPKGKIGAASRLLKFGGAALAVGAGAFMAYKGYSAAEDSKQAKLEDVQNRFDSGEITPEQAAAEREKIGNSATIEKSTAVGGGTGLAAGAIAGGAAGAKLGATIGTFVGGPVGTAVGAGIGTLAGGALGAFAGTEAGKYVGEKIGAAYTGAKDLGTKAVDSISSTGSKIAGFFGFGDKNKPSEVGPVPSVAPQQPSVRPSTPPAQGATMMNASAENADLQRAAGASSPSIQPVVSNNVNNTSTTSYVPMNSTPRPPTSGSALDRYLDRVAVY